VDGLAAGRGARNTMTLGQVHHYATEHYDFHHSQLTLQ
jgi:hypothetical protein